MVRSYEYIVDLFNRFDSAETFALDPAGLSALREAKRVRRAAIRSRDETAVIENAKARFGMPESRLDYSRRLGAPIYPPDRDASS